MAWYRTGTVAVTASSTVVTGTGTLFAANARVGDGFVGPDGRMYEVTNVASELVISIFPAYKGTTASAQAYAIIPVQGYPKQLADRAGVLVGQVAGLPGRMDSAEDTLAGLGTAAGGTLTTSRTDTTTGRVLRVGDFVVGGRVGAAQSVYFNDLPALFPYSGMCDGIFISLNNEGLDLDNYYYVEQFFYGTTGNLTQRITPYFEGSCAFRTRYSGVWSPWITELDNRNVLKAEVAGGTLIRIAPLKLQIITHKAIVAGSSQVPYGNLWQSQYGWTFPAVFSSPPAVTAMGTIGNSAAWMTMASLPTPAGVILRFMDISPNPPDNSPFSAIAIGSY